MRTRLQKNSPPREGLVLLAAIVALMWAVEIFNSIDGGALTADGIIARDVPQLWGVLTSPFIHASFTHLFDNTLPLIFCGAIIAWRGAVRLAVVTALVIVLGGLGTWLISPAGTDTIGASGVVFGYATYLMTRGVFDRKLWEMLVGVFVAIVWGSALLSSLLPQSGVSWQAHLCGGAAGVLIAWRLAEADRRRRSQTAAGLAGPAAGPRALRSR